LEAYRLKNIVILILVFLNLFLLGMLGRHLWQERSTQLQLEEELRRLYAANDLRLAEEIDLTSPPPDSLTLSRDLTAEAAVAAFILGETAAAENQGGGIYSYTGIRGTVRFRSNGAFDYAPLRHPVDDAQDFCQSFCRSFGYRLTEQSISGQSGSILALQLADGAPVYNAPVSFLFEDGFLTGISGSYITLTDNSTAQASTVTRATALVRLLDYLNQRGTVSSLVSAISPVYELQPTSASSPRLAAKWEILTDTGNYYADCQSGEIHRG